MVTGQFHRRLSDKILAAFGQANAAGEAEIARRLREALDLAEGRDRARTARFAERRHREGNGDRAKWAIFVGARNAYRAACEHGGDDEALSRAIDRMKDAYRSWSMS